MLYANDGNSNYFRLLACRRAYQEIKLLPNRNCKTLL